MKMTFLSLHHLIFSTVYVHLCVCMFARVCVSMSSPDTWTCASAHVRVNVL